MSDALVNNSDVRARHLENTLREKCWVAAMSDDVLQNAISSIRPFCLPRFDFSDPEMVM
eukprot:ANDGO_04205.mRNA.1 hypothetical protein